MQSTVLRFWVEGRKARPDVVAFLGKDLVKWFVKCTITKIRYTVLLWFVNECMKKMWYHVLWFVKNGCTKRPNVEMICENRCMFTSLCSRKKLYFWNECIHSMLYKKCVSQALQQHFTLEKYHVRVPVTLRLASQIHAGRDELVEFCARQENRILLLESLLYVLYFFFHY